MATGGGDGFVKFWDTRMLRNDGPVRVLAGHEHGVTCVRYNRYHDQLLATGGTDMYAKLWRVSSVSSAPLLDLADDVGPDAGFGTSTRPMGDTSAGTVDDARDALVQCCDVHNESVYAVEWCANDAWVYLSLAYNGQVAVNHVPSAEKYKILL